MLAKCTSQEKPQNYWLMIFKILTENLQGLLKNRCKVNKNSYFVICRQSRIARRTDAIPSDRKVSTERKTIAGPYRGNNFTTPIKTPAKFLPSTNEKATLRPATDIKKWSIEESTRITEYLRRVQADVGKDFFNRTDGIRSMSTKDLVSILNFFLASVGNRLEIKSAKDYVEETIKSMDKLKYPYSLTKSSLKTPTAPHSFPNIVQLLSWLKNLHMHQFDQEGWEDELLVFQENIYPNLESQKYIQSVSTESFKIWNSNQGEEEDQFGDIEDKAIGKIIYEKTGISTISKFLQINEQNWKKCESLQKDIANIQIPDDQQEKLLTLETKSENYQKEINVLEMNRKCIEVEISEMRSEIDRLQIQDKDLLQSIEKLKNAINGQKATVQERDEQVNKILYLEAKVNAAKNTIKEIQENGSNDNVMETRLLSKIPILIGNLKNFMSRVEDMTKSSVFKNIYLDDNKNFQKLLLTVKKIKAIFIEAELKYQEKDNNFQQKVANVKEKSNALDMEISAMHCKINVLIDKISALEITSSNLNEEAVTLQEFCATHKNKLISDLKAKDIEIRNKILLLEDIQNKVKRFICINFLESCIFNYSWSFVSKLFRKNNLTSKPVIARMIASSID